MKEAGGKDKLKGENKEINLVCIEFLFCDKCHIHTLLMKTQWVTPFLLCLGMVAIDAHCSNALTEPFLSLRNVLVWMMNYMAITLFIGIICSISQTD